MVCVFVFVCSQVNGDVEPVVETVDSVSQLTHHVHLAGIHIYTFICIYVVPSPEHVHCLSNCT